MNSHRVIDPQKMVIILSDVHLAEAAVQGTHPDELDSLSKLYYYNIFELHQVSEKEFYDSYDYYTRHPSEFQNVYDSVIVHLKTRPVFQKIKDAPRPKNRNIVDTLSKKYTPRTSDNDIRTE